MPNNYETLIEYTDSNLEKLFMLSGLVYLEFQDQFFSTESVFHSELIKAYEDKVKSVLLYDIADGTKLDSLSITEFVETIYEIFLEKDPNKYRIEV